MIDNGLYSHRAAVVLVEQMDVGSVDAQLPSLVGCLCAEPGRPADKEVKGIAPAATGLPKEGKQTLLSGSVKALQRQDGGLLSDRNLCRWFYIDRCSACTACYACCQRDQESYDPQRHSVTLFDDETEVARATW